jgi:transcriptional regulator with XRE-family HTH domain
MKKPRLNRLSIVLDECDVDQIELSKILEVTKDTVSRWCRNVNQPNLHDLNKIAWILRIDIIRLIEPTNWENEPELTPLEQFRIEQKNIEQQKTKQDKILVKKEKGKKAGKTIR